MSGQEQGPVKLIEPVVSQSGQPNVHGEEFRIQLILILEGRSNMSLFLIDYIVRGCSRQIQESSIKIYFGLF